MIFFPEFTGLLRYLVSNGKNHLIHVTTNGNEKPSRPPSLIITYPNSDHWASLRNFGFGQFIQVELKHMMIDITHYSFENMGAIAYSMNWQFLGSKNGHDWEVLDEHINDSVLGQQLISVFPTESGKFSFFRILHTGLNYYSDCPDTNAVRTILYVRNLDLFGSILDNNTCGQSSNLFYLILYIFLAPFCLNSQ